MSPYPATALAVQLPARIQSPSGTEIGRHLPGYAAAGPVVGIGSGPVARGRPVRLRSAGYVSSRPHAGERGRGREGGRRWGMS
jgi:hypothetical protein